MTQTGSRPGTRAMPAAAAGWLDRATANTVGLDRFWRNARTHTLHDPVAWKEREVGAHFLTGELAPPTLYT